MKWNCVKCGVEHDTPNHRLKTCSCFKQAVKVGDIITVEFPYGYREKSGEIMVEEINDSYVIGRQITSKGKIDKRKAQYGYKLINERWVN